MNHLHFVFKIERICELAYDDASILYIPSFDHFFFLIILFISKTKNY